MGNSLFCRDNTLKKDSNFSTFDEKREASQNLISTTMSDSPESSVESVTPVPRKSVQFSDPVVAGVKVYREEGIIGSDSRYVTQCNRILDT